MRQECRNLLAAVIIAIGTVDHPALNGTGPDLALTTVWDLSSIAHAPIADAIFGQDGCLEHFTPHLGHFTDFVHVIFLGSDIGGAVVANEATVGDHSRVQGVLLWG